MDAEVEDVQAEGEDLSALIVRVLAARGKTQTWLAKESGIPLPTLNAWVKRTRGQGGRIDPDTLRRLASALGVTTAEVFEAAGRRAPGPLDAERERKLLTLYRQMPVESQRLLVQQAELLAKMARAS